MSSVCSSRLRVRTLTGLSNEIPPISQRRRVPPTALLTVFSHGFSIRNRSTAANFGYLSMIILMVGTVFILDPFMWLENEYSIA